LHEISKLNETLSIIFNYFQTIIYHMQMKTSALLIIFTLCTAQHSWGNTTPEQDQKRFLQTGQQQWLRQLENNEQTPAAKDGQQAAPVLTQQDLLARPQLLARMLLQV